ncbi:polyunsaturated fatty acid (12S)/(13S)-lipoxygenase, epidermal-type-like, partial [Panthera onca]
PRVRARSPSCRRREFEVSVPVHLGRLLLAKLRKILLDDAWFCERISARPGDPGRAASPAAAGCGATRPSACPRAPVRVWGAARGAGGSGGGGGVAVTPRGDRRKGGAGADRVQGGLCSCSPPARTLSDDHQDFLKAQREQELQERKKVYRWGSRKDGSILPVAGRTQCDLPRNERFLEDKDFDFRVSPAKAPAPGGGWAPAPRDAKQGPFLVSRHGHSFRRPEGLASRVPWTSHSQLK